MLILDFFTCLFSAARNQTQDLKHCLKGIFLVAYNKKHKESKINSFVKVFHDPSQ